LSSAKRGRASGPARTHRRHQADPTRLKILYLASHFPFPADSGAAIKSLSIIDHLRERHTIRLLTTTDQPLTEEQERWAAGLGVVRTMQVTRARSAWNLLRSYLARVPLSVERNRSKAMAGLAETECEDFSPDVILVDGWLAAQYLPARFAGGTLLHEHNAEYELWERQAQLETFPRKWLVSREAKRVRRYEASILPRFDRVFAVSAEDRRALGRAGGDLNKIRVLPNIPSPELLTLPALSFAATQPVILYFGTLSWQPNVEGLERFLNFPLNQIIKRAPAARLAVAGRGASPELVAKITHAPNTDYLGEVDGSEDLYRRARVVVDSSRSGGGTRLKILNALARGVPVVASAEAARGLDIVPGEHMIVARNEHALIEGVVSVLEDAEGWRKLSENGRALVRARYVPEVAFGALDEALTAIARKRR
jgi:glycosyltransferase involved in cell wall biosynthesis